MTAQIPEVLMFNGEKHSLCSRPLDDYFSLVGVSSPFDARYSTALWRSYIGTWEIIEDRLYLISLKGWRAGHEGNYGISLVFPGHAERVFAHWYSGIFRIPHGRLLEYQHIGFASVYESDIFLRFESGQLVERRDIKNGEPDQDAPTGYQIAAATYY